MIFTELAWMQSIFFVAMRNGFFVNLLNLKNTSYFKREVQSVLNSITEISTQYFYSQNRMQGELQYHINIVSNSKFWLN